MSIARRIVPLILVLAVASAPLAFELCEVACATRDAIAAGGPAVDAHHHQAAAHEGRTATHSCHDATQAAAGTLAVGASPHLCGHGDDLPVSGGPLGPTAVTSPVSVATLVSPDPFAPRLLPTRTTGPSPLPIPIPLLTALRV